MLPRHLITMGNRAIIEGSLKLEQMGAKDRKVYRITSSKSRSLVTLTLRTALVMHCNWIWVLLTRANNRASSFIPIHQFHRSFNPSKKSRYKGNCSLAKTLTGIIHFLSQELPRRLRTERAQQCWIRVRCKMETWPVRLRRLCISQTIALRINSKELLISQPLQGFLYLLLIIIQVENWLAPQA